MKKTCVVLSSGGIDSTVSMAMAAREGYEIYSLTFSYGQRHSREIDAAIEAARSLGAVEHKIVSVDLKSLGGSALTADIDVPRDRRSDEMLDEVPPTYVPFRNTIFLSIAVAWAEVIEAESVFAGMNAVDFGGYPDCRPEYVEVFQKLVEVGTKAGATGKKIAIRTPLLKMTKEEIIRAGHELKIDFGATWSCYDPQAREGGFIPCGRCDSCILRLKGFRDAGLVDPLQYAERPDA